MKLWKKALVISAAIGLSASIGAVTASAIDDPNPPGPAPAGDVRLLGNGVSENRYVPKIPCRILDTRKGYGKLQVGQPKAIDVRGTEATFTIQGGNPGGCNIPTRATAIEATVTAIDSGSGFLRAWPANLTQPNATFLNYDSSFNVSNTGTITLCGENGLSCNSNQDLNLQAYGTATHLVIDVAGYYMQPMSGNFTSGGGIVRASRVTSSVREGTGIYTVTFDRNITQCTYFGGVATANAGLNSGYAAVTNRSGQANAVSVLTYSTAGELTDKAFQLDIIC